MMTGESKAPFSDDNWLVRNQVGRISRHCRLPAAVFPALLAQCDFVCRKISRPVFNAVSAISTPMILDGEIVVLDDEGKPNFQKLQLYSQEDGATHHVLCV